MPVDKTTAVAALVEAEVVAGKSRVVFTRPFSSPEGVTLVEDRFVWIIASVRTVSDDFDAKHDIAGTGQGGMGFVESGKAEGGRCRVYHLVHPPSPTPQHTHALIALVCLA